MWEKIKAEFDAFFTKLRSEIADTKAATDRAVAAEAKNLALEASLKTATDEVAARGTALETAVTKVGALDAQIVTLNATVTARDGELAAANKKISDLGTAIEQKAWQRASEIIGAQATEPAPLSQEDAGAVTAKNAMEKFNAIQDPKARAEFYEKHQDKLP